MVSQLAGNTSQNYISKIYLINTWLFLLLIGLGFLYLILHPRNNRFGSKTDESINLKDEFEPEFMFITAICMIALAMTVTLPFLSNVYDLTRIYLQVSVVISVIFIVGGKYAATNINTYMGLLQMNTSKNESKLGGRGKLSYIIILAVLIPQFLLMANVPQELTGNGVSIILNSTCPPYNRFYIHESDVSCIQWWGNNKLEGYEIRGDHFGAVHMISQGNIPDRLQVYENSDDILKGECIYLRETNVVKNQIYYDHYSTGSTRDEFLNKHTLSKLYSAPATILYYSDTTFIKSPI